MPGMVNAVQPSDPRQVAAACAALPLTCDQGTQGLRRLGRRRLLVSRRHRLPQPRILDEEAKLSLRLMNGTSISEVWAWCMGREHGGREGGEGRGKERKEREGEEVEGRRGRRGREEREGILERREL
eukprot:754795-Hanusia_phi.AAC.3